MFLRLLSRVQLRTQALDGLDARLTGDTRIRELVLKKRGFVWFYYPTARVPSVWFYYRTPFS